MGTDEIISVALAGINLLSKSIEAANSGDVETAKRHLSNAREHFSQSVAAWDAAGHEEGGGPG